MVTIGEQLYQYALGKKGHRHWKRNKRKKRFAKENKNVTAVQDFLSAHWKSFKESIGEKVD